MVYDPFELGPSNMIKKGMELREKSAKYKERNEPVDLPNLITQEVYRDGELTVEVICTHYINIGEMIGQQTIKRVLNSCGFTGKIKKEILKYV